MYKKALILGKSNSDSELLLLYLIKLNYLTIYLSLNQFVNNIVLRIIYFFANLTKNRKILTLY